MCVLEEFHYYIVRIRPMTQSAKAAHDALGDPISRRRARRTSRASSAGTSRSIDTTVVAPSCRGRSQSRSETRGDRSGGTSRSELPSSAATRFQEHLRSTSETIDSAAGHDILLPTTFPPKPRLMSRAALPMDQSDDRSMISDYASRDASSHRREGSQSSCESDEADCAYRPAPPSRPSSNTSRG